MDGMDFGTGTYDRARGGPVQYSSQGQLIRFYQRSVLIPFETERQGKPVYRAADYVKVSTPGEHDEIDREATPSDKKLFEVQYRAYLEGKADIPTGTLLTVLFPNNPEIVDGMKDMKLHTVEQLASMSDHQIQNLPLGGLEWRAKAMRFLEVTKDAGRFGELEQKQRELAYKLEKQAEENQALRDRLAELEAPEDDDTEAAPRRGRPPKTARA